MLMSLLMLASLSWWKLCFTADCISGDKIEKYWEIYTALLWLITSAIPLNLSQGYLNLAYAMSAYLSAWKTKLNDRSKLNGQHVLCSELILRDHDVNTTARLMLTFQIYLLRHEFLVVKPEELVTTWVIKFMPYKLNMLKVTWKVRQKINMLYVP